MCSQLQEGRKNIFGQFDQGKKYKRFDMQYIFSALCTLKYERGFYFILFLKIFI